MKITCPNCNASGNIPDYAVPQTGRFLTCPKCNHGFTVTKPKTTADTYEVDVCPACNYSTFTDERFSTCPKCGVMVKTFLDRQKEEQQRQRDFEALHKKHTREIIPPPPLEEAAPEQHESLLDHMHPVNLVGWGCAVLALVMVGFGIAGILDVDSAAIKAKLSEHSEEQVSSFYVFFRYSLAHWLKLLFGFTFLATSACFIQQRQFTLKAMSMHLRVLMAAIPAYQVACFIIWILQPVPHTISGYLLEIISMLFISAIFCTPLFLLDRFLENKQIVSVVTRPWQD